MAGFEFKGSNEGTLGGDTLSGHNVNFGTRATTASTFLQSPAFFLIAGAFSFIAYKLLTGRKK